MRRIILSICAIFLSLHLCHAQSEEKLFDYLNLDYPGLEQVKSAYEQGNIDEANAALLRYFQQRKQVNIYGTDLENVTISKEEQRWADESLEHRFFSHKGYQPSYFYGEDINWQYWPIKDNELRWQLHRHKWFIPLAKAYKLTGDEKYAQAWIYQYSDWVKKNPLPEGYGKKKSGTTISAGVVDIDDDNAAFAWRPLETARRAQDQLEVIAHMIHSPNVTPEFLNMFLYQHHRHVEYLQNNYSKHGNHLLFEAQRMLYATIYFPEYKESKAWEAKAVSILCDEVNKQVYADGIHYELSYGYHLAVVNIFLKALCMAQINDVADIFPPAYAQQVESMMKFAYNTITPDYSNTMYGDTKQIKKNELIKQFRNWSKIFPENEEIRWFATEGKEGIKPSYTSCQFPVGGFYVMRSGWDEEATVSIVKAGPPAFWHDQPDIGSFHFWRKGRDFFPDSGCYVYAGDDEVMKQREWFRQTCVHNTVTLDDKNLETTDAKQLVWEEKENLVTFVYENQSYQDLKHRRSFFFVDNDVLVIVDEVSGDAQGRVSLNFGLLPAQLDIDKATNTVTTLFDDNNNIAISTISPSSTELVEKEGWVSYGYRQKEERPAYAIESDKSDNKDMIFVSIITPQTSKYSGKVSAKMGDTKLDNKMSVKLKIGSSSYKLGYKLK